MGFASFGLSPRTREGVESLGYTEPTPIQRQAIPHALAGRDVVGCAQTGTGKTAAFVLPVLERVARGRGVRALIVTPTRELAQQVADVSTQVARATGHRTAVLYGGVGYEQQLAAIRRAEVVIATPGRLLDIHARGALDLSGVEVLVLDEADRMLDMGFWPDVRRIIALLPSQRQNLLFSATMSEGVLRIVPSTLHDPVFVQTAPATTPVERIEQRIFPVAAEQKAALLMRLLERPSLERVLVFARTKHRADRVHRVLSRAGISCAAIHGGRTQAQRQAALEGFRSGRHRVLVATDVVARGIDVDGVSHVINFDLPSTPEDYVHRIGRTARAGASGSALSFLAPEEYETFSAIERALGAPLACEDVEGFAYAHRIVPRPERTVSRAPRQVFSSGGMGRRTGVRHGARRTARGR